MRSPAPGYPLACFPAARAISSPGRSARRGASRTRCRPFSRGGSRPSTSATSLSATADSPSAAASASNARMIDETHPMTKRRFGIGAYLHTGLKVGLSRKSFGVRVEVDGSVIEREATSLMVANFGTVLDQLFVLGPGIEQDDGLLDLCILLARGRSGRRPHCLAAPPAGLRERRDALLPERARVPHRVRSAAALSGRWRDPRHHTVLHSRRAARGAAARRETRLTPAPLRVHSGDEAAMDEREMVRR